MNAGTAPATFLPAQDRASESPADRLWLSGHYWLHRLFRRRMADATEFSVEVARRTAWLAGESLETRVAPLRYRLRTSGFTSELLTESFALYCAASRRVDPLPGDPAATVVGAARGMVQGAIVQLTAVADRRQALAFAAAALAMRGTPVHLLAASAARARLLAQMLGPPLGELGIGVGLVEPGMQEAARREAHSRLVVCGALREIGLDFLRERAARSGPPRRVLATLDRLAGDSPAGAQVRQSSALVDEADQVLLDDTRIPLALSVEYAAEGERLLYEQALELARSLRGPDDFVIDCGSVQLTPRASGRLERLTQALGGPWAVREHREELIAYALSALHLLRRDRDYRVVQGRVVFPPASAEEAEPTLEQEVQQRLVEAKEGCRLSGERVVVAQIAVPRLLGRYTHLAGACHDVRAPEREFWRLYRVQTVCAERIAEPSQWSARIFAGDAAQRQAIVESACSRGTRSLVIALRSPAAAEALSALLMKAGIRPAVVRGVGDAADEAAAAALEQPGSVVLSLYPGDRTIHRANEGAAPHLIVAELLESERQLEHIRLAYGAGSCALLLSLEDPALKAHLGARKLASATRALRGGSELPAKEAQRSFRYAQRNAERAAESARRDAFALERSLDDLLAFSGERE